MRKTEFGGCLPLEEIENKNNPYINMPRIEMNSARSCILEALRLNNIDTIWIPAYMCPTVKDFLVKYGILVKEYHIDDDYMPIDVKLQSDEMIMWTNYYGCMFSSTINKMLEFFEKDKIIFDNSQAFFTSPVLDAWNVYSCRKFVGIPEGAYLIHDKLEINSSYPNINNTWDYLEVARVCGSNSAYKDYLLDNEKFSESMGMSYLTREYLKAVDFERIALIRKQNFNRMHEILGKYNELVVDYNDKSPIAYPFLFKNNSNIRRELLSMSIFTPVWWKRILVDDSSTEYERYLANNLIPLPIDQRYRIEDIEYIGNVVERSIAEWDL